MHTPQGVIRVIGFEDIILDRLRACKHWTSARDCEQAESLLTLYCDGLDWEYLHRGAAAGATADMLLDLRRRAEGNRRALSE